MSWDTKRIVIFSIPFALLLLGVASWFFLRKTIRTRPRMDKQLRDDPDIDEWLVVFNWSRKVLYLPTVIVSLLAFAAMVVHEQGLLQFLDPAVVGGVWLGVFFVNFLIDEYEVNLKILFLAILCLLLLGLWLTFMDWLAPFLRMFRHLCVRINSTGYLIIALIFLSAVVVSWIRGLFYYAAITPNFLNVQAGPTETGEQISREDYNTRIDTGDFLERVLGFGRIVVNFHEARRPPLILLVGRIGQKARKLESIRSILSVDRHRDKPLDSTGG